MKPRIALGIGNTSVQLALFAGGSFQSSLPAPRWHVTRAADADFSGLAEQSQIPQQAEWVVASVNQPTAARARQWAKAFAPDDYRILDRSDFTIVMDVEHPERVGKDRLAAATAAGVLRKPDQAAIVVDAGTAITVNALDTAGRFVGGAILPGTLIGARALSTWTDALPEISVDWRTAYEPPPVIGKSTEEALASGVYWAAVGAVRELVQRMTAELGSQPAVYVTGGFGHQLARHLEAAEHIPHLVVAGIALAGNRQQATGNS